MKLIVGLGNPGGKYVTSRHNAGFWFLDAFAAHKGIVWSENDKKLSGDWSKIKVDSGSEAVLLKPNTFMNLSGKSVRSALTFYKIKPQDTLVLHDEVELAPGDIRLKVGGGHGGHNGIRSMVAEIGLADFSRVRIGVGRPEVLQSEADRGIADYVLKALPFGEVESFVTAHSAKVFDLVESFLINS